MGTALGYKSPIVDLTVKEAKDKFSMVDFYHHCHQKRGR